MFSILNFQRTCRELDLSVNRFTVIENISHLKKLRKLFLCMNKISVIQNLEGLESLEMLELGDNRIRVSGGSPGSTGSNGNQTAAVSLYRHNWKDAILEREYLWVLCDFVG